ncbi:hypothetical protein [Phycicoccus avicenniae]|uniref:hypothetical protein n=1 Tax=Phycicoccus avicenniae TaxID=2828860 RepID=UPI003D2A10D6
MSAVAARRPVSVAELQRAYRGVLSGHYRTPAPGAERAIWTSAAPVLPVIGACAGTGASTLALAVATAAGRAWLVECSSPTTSRLTAAATEELGREGEWARGARGPVTLLRPATPVHTLSEVQVPPDVVADGLCVLDVGWDVSAVVAGDCWLTDVLARPGVVVVVAPATVPGARRLDAVLRVLDHAAVTVALVGSRRPAPAVRTLLETTLRGHEVAAANIVNVAQDSRLAERGVDSRPLPPALVRAAQAIVGATRQARGAA